MTAAYDRRPRLIAFMHSSNEMYGADKIVLEVLRALPESDRKRTEVWLPDDLPVGQNRLSFELDSIGVIHDTQPLAVLRRRYLSVSKIAPLISRLWKTFLRLRTKRPDVVYCTTSAMVLCLALARFAGVKHVVLHMQEIWSPREAAVLGLFGRAAHRIFCISGAALDSLPAHLQSRAELLLNAHSEPGSDLVPIRSDDSHLRFVVASRWNSWKGHRSLLDAWNSETCPGELVILGGPPAMGTGVDVPGLIAQVRHGAFVSVVGEVDDITPHIDAADFLILPSEKPEPFGLVLLEAFARGRAVVASDAGGVLDVVTDGFDGRLYPIGRATDLAATLISLDRSMAAQMGKNARISYEQKFSIEAYRTHFRELWTQMTNEDKRG
ncbi:glycosyltransferase family 4 protein [Arthrobacter sp. efr-133-TYG-118]|uniref:glycosyltransferase family 4 protein n=1 Tax=Arthrobacter sp. efr-133-TYG-118 TaxID=3040279 RepID=UPI00254C6247|nr:glycosyltransferase family 4 protein [Arthrobacter sp. efr-133-TYG-118]